MAVNPMQWIVREAGKRPEVNNRVVELVSQRGSMTRKALLRATGVSSASIDRHINAGVAAGVLRRVPDKHGQVRVELA